MVQKLFLIILVVLLTITGSCKKCQHKYPEDTDCSKLNAIDRLSNKWWRLTNTTLNGANYTDTVLQQVGNFRIFFSKSKLTKNGTEHNSGEIKTDLEGSFKIVWDFTESENYFTISRHTGYALLFALAPCYYAWSDRGYRILKLNSSEFKISMTTDDGLKTVVHYFQKD